MKIVYTDVHYNEIIQLMNSSISKCKSSISTINNLSIPSDFSRRSKLISMTDDLRRINTTLETLNNWVTKTNNAFIANENNASNRIIKIELPKIKSKDLYVK